MIGMLLNVLSKKFMKLFCKYPTVMVGDIQPHTRVLGALPREDEGDLFSIHFTLVWTRQMGRSPAFLFFEGI